MDVGAWWSGLSGNWDWEDPVLLLGVVTVAVTALIPIALWYLARKQTKRDSVLQEQQAKSLSRQERILERQRRDELLDAVRSSADETHLSLIWSECKEYRDRDLALLLAAFRANTRVALPGTRLGLYVDDVVDAQAVSDYAAGLERRYSSPKTHGDPYPGLFDFIKYVNFKQQQIDSAVVVDLVTGGTASVQRPGHGFYRELVNLHPECTSGLLMRVEGVDSRQEGGTKLNILSGALLGIKDIELGRRDGVLLSDEAAEVIRNQVPSSLAHLLHRDVLRSFDMWSLEGSTEPVSATVAWLIRVVGWLSVCDSHLAMRMIQNLEPAIRSIPERDRSWGIDIQDVSRGLELIAENQPDLWSRYGQGLLEAASGVSGWEEPAPPLRIPSAY